MNKIQITLITILVLIIGVLAIPNTYTIEQVEVERVVEVDRMEQKIEEMKWEVVDAIERCESGGYEEDDAVIVFDSNTKASIGTMQWQVPSVQDQVRKLEGRDITRKEAVLLALDREEARNLAYRTIWEEVGGVFRWQNCAYRTGVIPTIEMVRTLEQ